MADDSEKAEELLQRSKEQKRATSEPDEPTPDEGDVPGRVEAIKDALVAVENDEVPENLNIRDGRLKALFVGLEASGELGDVVRALDGDVEKPTQSDVARVAIRAALREAVPEVLADAQEAYELAAVELADEF